MINLWRMVLGPVSCRNIGGVSAETKTVGIDLKKQVDSIGAAPPPDKPAPGPTAATLGAIHDDVKILSGTKGLPEGAQKLIDGIEDATKRLDAKVKAGQPIAKDDPDLKALHDGVEQLNALLEKGPAGKAEAPPKAPPPARLDPKVIADAAARFKDGDQQ